jgi:hypothetical protein
MTHCHIAFLAVSFFCSNSYQLIFADILKIQKKFQIQTEFWVVYHLHGKPIRFKIVLMESKISDRKSHSDYALSI